MIQQITIKGKQSYIYLSLNAFDKLRKYLEMEYNDKKYGWIFSNKPILIKKNSPWGIFNLANVIQTYLPDNIILEIVGEYNEYMQMIKLYNEKLEPVLFEKLQKAHINLTNPGFIN